MPETTLHILVKKKYAVAIIKDLEKLNAIEILNESHIPKWQQKEVQKRLKDIQQHPVKALEWNEVMKRLRKPNKTYTLKQQQEFVSKSIKKHKAQPGLLIPEKDAWKLINKKNKQ